MVKFMPSEFKLTETRQPPLKDQYDEWLARVICYAFSVPASAFVSQVNRATSETLRMQATQEGLVPLKAWVKTALDQVVQIYLKQPDLEFVWVGDDAVDPLEQAQTLNILVSAGIKTREEARADLGLAPEGKVPSVAKYNHNHDEQGRFTTADGAVGPGRGITKPEPTTAQPEIAQGPTVPIFEEPPLEPIKPLTERPPIEPQRAAPSSSSWGNPATLMDHFERHGGDFGAVDALDYATQANSFFQRSATAGYPRKIDIDGTIRIYDPTTNTFGSYNSDGTTKTFFKPTSNAYWNRQPGK
jgi:hypothetical protein